MSNIFQSKWTISKKIRCQKLQIARIYNFWKIEPNSSQDDDASNYERKFHFQEIFWVIKTVKIEKEREWWTCTYAYIHIHNGIHLYVFNLSLWKGKQEIAENWNQYKTEKSQLENTNQRRKWKEHEEACLGGVEPNQIERVEIERRVRTVEDGPGTELSGSKARYDDAGKLGVVAGEIAGGDGAWVESSMDEKEKEEERDWLSHWQLERGERERERYGFSCFLFGACGLTFGWGPESCNFQLRNSSSVNNFPIMPLEGRLLLHWKW